MDRPGFVGGQPIGGIYAQIQSQPPYMPTGVTHEEVDHERAEAVNIEAQARDQLMHLFKRFPRELKLSSAEPLYAMVVRPGAENRTVWRRPQPPPSYTKIIRNHGWLIAGLRRVTRSGELILAVSTEGLPTLVRLEQRVPIISGETFLSEARALRSLGPIPIEDCFSGITSTFLVRRGGPYLDELRGHTGAIVSAVMGTLLGYGGWRSVGTAKYLWAGP